MKTCRCLVKAEAKPNKSLDVRAKQRLCYRVVFLTQTGLVAVSPHVNSIVRRFVLNLRNYVESDLVS
jgi:hypothetical protein